MGLIRGDVHWSPDGVEVQAGGGSTGSDSSSTGVGDGADRAHTESPDVRLSLRHDSSFCSVLPLKVSNRRG